MSARKYKIVRTKSCNATCSSSSGSGGNFNSTNSQSFRRPLNQDKKDEVFFYLGGNISSSVKEGKVIAGSIRDINSKQKPEPLPLTICSNKPDLITFFKCLDVYENNQSYYSDNIEELIKLEKWFSKISEPYSRDPEWATRENNRKVFGISDYCDEDIRKFLLPKRKCLLSSSKT